VLNREHVTDALKFWEPARLAYNLALAATVAWQFAPLYSGETAFRYNALELVPQLIVLAGLANLVFCAAYPLDLFVQASDFRASRGVWRLVILTTGTLMGVSLAWLMSSGIVAGASFE